MIPKKELHFILVSTQIKCRSTCTWNISLRLIPTCTWIELIVKADFHLYVDCKISLRLICTCMLIVTYLENIQITPAVTCYFNRRCTWKYSSHCHSLLPCTHIRKHTHQSYTILLPPSNISTQWLLVILTSWWNSITSYEDQHSPNKSTTYQRAPYHAGISEPQFTFLMEICFDPIIYFSMIYATTWYFLSVNSQLIFTPSLPMD